MTSCNNCTPDRRGNHQPGCPGNTPLPSPKGKAKGAGGKATEGGKHIHNYVTTRSNTRYEVIEGKRKKITYNHQVCNSAGSCNQKAHLDIKTEDA